MPNRPRYDRKLEMILQEASRVFADKGYHQATVRDIARATGVSLAGLYYYFKSKEDLLFLVLDHSLGRLLSRQREALEGVTDPRARFQILIRNHLGFFAGAEQEMKVLIREAASVSGEMRERVADREREYAGILYRILKDLAPEENAPDLRVATFSLFGMLNWVYTWYVPDRHLPVERLARELEQIFLNGYSAGILDGA
ncbi:MAG: TetR family transcriptional regulator [Gemmatimonadetes bacterium]|nr:TetR family transcriptional regulator [Gemmatimonadota bacterium]